jgi:hypothetical protein
MICLSRNCPPYLILLGCSWIWVWWRGWWCKKSGYNVSIWYCTPLQLSFQDDLAIYTDGAPSLSYQSNSLSGLCRPDCTCRRYCIFLVSSILGHSYARRPLCQCGWRSVQCRTGKQPSQDLCWTERQTNLGLYESDICCGCIAGIWCR